MASVLGSPQAPSVQTLLHGPAERGAGRAGRSFHPASPFLLPVMWDDCSSLLLSTDDEPSPAGPCLTPDPGSVSHHCLIASRNVALTDLQGAWAVLAGREPLLTLRPDLPPKPSFPAAPSALTATLAVTADHSFPEGQIQCRGLTDITYFILVRVLLNWSEHSAGEHSCSPANMLQYYCPS